MAVTSADGRYRVAGLEPDAYHVRFQPGPRPPQNVLPIAYQQRRDPASADSVTVADGQAVTGIDAQLPRGGTLSGRLTVRGTGQPLAGACVTARPVPDQPAFGPIFSSADTDASGAYTLVGLATTQYTVEFAPTFRGGGVLPSGSLGACSDSSQNYFTEYFHDAQTADAATRVPVTAGSDVTDIDQQVSPAGSISGRVSDGAGSPISGLCVGVGESSSEGLAITDGDGRYALQLLRAGSYDVRFAVGGSVPGSGAPAQCLPEGTYAAHTVCGVLVGDGQAVGGVDAVLSPSGPESYDDGCLGIRVVPSLTLRVRRLHRAGRRVRLAVSGRLKGPAGFNSGDACGGDVHVSVRSHRRTLVSRRPDVTGLPLRGAPQASAPRARAAGEGEGALRGQPGAGAGCGA